MKTYTYTDADGEVKTVSVEDSVYAKLTQLDEREKLDERRETRRSQSLELSIDNGWDVEDPNADVEQIAYINEWYRKLHAVLDKLPKKQRELVQKVFFERIPKSKIAEQEGVSNAAIYFRLQVILKKLKLFLQK